MCGIVGYIGENLALPVIINGLEAMEYRGYDSSGVAYMDETEIKIDKRVGKITDFSDELLETTKGKTINLSIGHNRWATHGEPSSVNAHPHLSMNGKFAVVHNGIIENHDELRDFLLEKQDIKFKSETDTEVIAQLFEFFYDGDLLKTAYKVVEKLRGAYAIAIIASDELDRMIAIRKDSPLIVGISKTGNYVASDIPAIMKYTKEILLIENDEIVELRKNKVDIYNLEKKKQERDIYHVDWDISVAEKGGYEHFTLKEIHEQADVARDTLNKRLKKDGTLNLEGVNISEKTLMNINKIYIASCGTSYHASLIGKRYLEEYFKIQVVCEYASEFRYGKKFIDENTLFICVSQSGETLDTLQSLREAKRLGAHTLAICNVLGSSIAREAEHVLYTWAGIEIGVASTKAFISQIMVFDMLALEFSRIKNSITEDEYFSKIRNLEKIAPAIEETFKLEDTIKEVAKKYYQKENVFFTGRALDYDLALEASLKFKELSYINSYAIAAGELKHGTIALINKETIVFAIVTQDEIFEKTLSNLKELRARGAKIVAIANEKFQSIVKTANEVIFIPDIEKENRAYLSIIPAQFLAYYVAKLKGNDVDKPRNLAKSVTVE